MDYFEIAKNGLPNLTEIESERAKRLAIMILTELEGPKKLIQEENELTSLIAKHNGETYREPFSRLKTFLDI